ncbi:MAG: FAD-dependent oxidoreductase, partial [Candidatus Methylomirabilia bacterium]
MLTRRQFLIGSGALAWWMSGCGRGLRVSTATRMNDIHSQLNSTWVDRVVLADSVEGLGRIVRRAGDEAKGISIAGGRHAMGGQQFGTGTILVDMTGMGRVLQFDPEEGLIEVEAGIQWPELMDYLTREQRGRPKQWGIIQKQTGADRLSIGGALAANIHSRALRLKPIIGDVESFVILGADGIPRRCDRRENADL